MLKYIVQKLVEIKNIVQENKSQYDKFSRAIRNLERVVLRNEEPFPAGMYLAGKNFDEPFYTGNPKQIILIASNPRVGSTLLMQGLFSTGLCPPSGEFFDSLHVESFYQRLGYMISDEEYLNLLYNYRTKSNGIFVVKAHYRSYYRFRDVLPLQSIDCIILIEREDKISQAISFFFGKNTGQWSSYAMARKSKKDIPYNYDEILNNLIYLSDMQKNWCDMLAYKDLNLYYITYENLNNSYQQCIADIAHWLSGRQFNPEDIALPKMKIQRDELNKQFKERFIKDLKAHSIDETKYQRLYWPEYQAGRKID